MRRAGPPGARAVLEVRSREVPFILEHGQIIGRLVFERLTDTPPQVYGDGLGSNYQRQGLKLRSISGCRKPDGYDFSADSHWS